MAIEIFSLIVALLAVIVGPMITYRITKKNLEFQFRTKTQENWIVKLDVAAVDFLNSSHQMFEKYPTLMERFYNDPKIKTEVNNQIDAMIDSMNLAMIRFQLLLDDSQPLQKAIIEETMKMKKILLKQDLNAEKVETLGESHEKIIKNFKAVLHNERSKITKLYR